MLDNNKILILFVDAFSFSYINKNDTPFLAKTDVKPLRPAFGFKQLAAAFTGLPSWTTGWYSEYIYEPKTSPYRWTRLLPPLLEKASGSFGRVLIDIFTKIITGRKNLSSRSIPLQLTRYFGVNEAPYPKSSNLVSYLMILDMEPHLLRNHQI